MSDLPLLLQRVREASGPDRGLDLNIGGLLLAWGATPAGEFDVNEPLQYSYPLGHFTASLDAAMALVERVRPGQAGVVSFGQVWSRTDFINAGDRVQLHETCRTPALSMVACLLASLVPQEAHEDDQG